MNQQTVQTEPILPGQWLGMLGGGQLGRMFCQAAQRMGYRVVVLDPDPVSPTGMLADRHLVCGYDDVSGLEALAAQCAAVSTEFENVPASTLEWLAQRVCVRPSAGAVAIAQDRLREKAFLVQAGVPVAPHAPAVHGAALAHVDAALFPGILKRARLGYDGKGQARVADRAQALRAWQALGATDCVLEAHLPLAFEVSVVLARDAAGHCAVYPPLRNVHRDGILAATWADALESEPQLAQQAQALAQRIAARLDYVGVLCVEFFVLNDGRLLVNEIAPRPHNSGHVTMDGSVCSQFEQQVRVLAGMPLGDTSSLRSAIMLNILGDIWFQAGTDIAREPDWARVLALSGTHLHLYGKQSVRKGRKMGHINIVGATPTLTQRTAAQAAQILGMEFIS